MVPHRPSRAIFQAVLTYCWGPLMLHRPVPGVRPPPLLSESAANAYPCIPSSSLRSLTLLHTKGTRLLPPSIINTSTRSCTRGPHRREGRSTHRRLSTRGYTLINNISTPLLLRPVALIGRLHLFASSGAFLSITAKKRDNGTSDASENHEDQRRSLDRDSRRHEHRRIPR